jgi:2-C-methyl-D-erythritol 2,4-cyclodiphosphate synthase
LHHFFLFRETPKKQKILKTSHITHHFSSRCLLSNMKNYLIVLSFHHDLMLLLSLVMATLLAFIVPPHATAAAFVLGASSSSSSSREFSTFSTSSRRSDVVFTTTAATAAAASTSTASSTANTNTDDLLRPDYEIEKIPLRIGHGFDIHRMAPRSEAGQPIVIGGVTIPHAPLPWKDVDGKYTSTPGDYYTTELGVVAHSDGDVIYHSVVDAIFGALTLPDIGQVFQDSDARWKGCDSSAFMQHAYTVMTRYGYRIGNIDVTLILERPKVATFKPAMKANIVSLLHTTPGRVNIKARTHERVDSVGELRSLSCHVVITLELLANNDNKESENDNQEKKS